MGFSGTPKDMGPPYGKRDPYHEPISLGIRTWEWYGNCMGPAYHKGVPLLGVPGITLELRMILKNEVGELVIVLPPSLLGITKTPPEI